MSILQRTPTTLAARPRARWMVERDLTDVTIIEHSVWDQPLNKRGVIRMLRGGDTLAYVSEHNDVVTGYAIFTGYCDFVEIKRMAVDPHHRGNGSGCCLIERLKERCRSISHIECLVACVSLRDLDTLEFFKRRGFRATCCIDSEGRDVICMEWLTN